MKHFNFLSLWGTSPENGPRMDRHYIEIDTAMSRKFFTILLVLFLCVGNMWGSWTRVTTMDELTSGGTFIMGYEATAKSGVIVPLRSVDCNATTSANGYFNTGTTTNSSTDGTIDMSNPGTTTNYEIYISSPSSGVINIQRSTSSGNYYGATSGGSTSNKARLYTSGNSNETNLTPEWANQTNNQFKLTAAVSGNYKYLKYNTGSPRFAFYNSAGEKIVFYKKGADVAYKVTYNAGTGSCTKDDDTEASPGAGVTLPSASPSSGCSTAGWTFAGWAEATCNETHNQPTLYTSGSKYYPTSATTLYAVYTLASTDYKKVTSTDDLSSGKYLIVYTSGKVALKNATTGTYYMDKVSVSISSNTISSPAATIIWDVTKTGSVYQFYNTSVSKWLDNYHSNSYYNLQLLSTKGKGYGLSINGSGWAVFSSNNDANAIIYYNTSNNRFAGATSGGTKNLHLYKKDDTFNSNPSCCTPLGSINGSFL